MTVGKLVIMRHGQTEHNVLSLVTGQADVPLTKAGEEQAREAGRHLSVIRFDKVYSSDLCRAFNTAALALEAAKTEKHLLNADGTWQVEKRHDIAEKDTGKFTGRNYKTDPEFLNWEQTYDKPLPGGESDKQVVERVRKFFVDEVMPRLLRGENVLIVAHSGILRALDVVMGVAAADESMWLNQKVTSNATPVVYEYENGLKTKSYTL